MKDLSNIMMIEFEDVGEEMVAVFDITKISADIVLMYLKSVYPLAHSKIIITSKEQWNTVFGD